MENATNNRVKEVRELLNFSQSEFAQKIGTTMTTVSRMETNAVPVSKKTIQRIIDVFGVSKDWLLTGNGEMNLNFVPGQETKVISTKTIEVLESKVEHLENEILFYRDLLLNLSHKVAANFNPAFGLAGHEITGKYQGKVIEMFAKSVRVAG